MNDLQKLIDKVIDKAIVGCDTYKHNGSTWLLFTDDKKWVIELTKEGTLWYNYYFFKKLFKVIALDVVENQHYITKWVEDTVINGVKSIKGEYYKEIQKVEDTIQNGVKYTSWHDFCDTSKIEDTIQNGVKKTYSDKIPHEYDWSKQFTEEIDDIIQNGVKHTEKSLQIDGSCVIEDVIKEGVKHTEYGDWLDGDERFDDIIENGVKETTPGGYLGSVEMKGKTVHQFEHAKQDNDVEKVINNGIKHTEISWSNFDRVDDVLEKGIKKTEAAALFDEESKMDTVISNGIKETHDDAYHHTGRVKGVIKNGVKECIPSRHQLYNPMDFSVQYRENHRLDDVASVLEKGIKETKAIDEWVNTDRIVDGVISNGKIIK
jgi:hypothetical protein